MSKTIYGKSINELVNTAIHNIIDDGIKMNTRNGFALALYNIDLILTNPKARHLCLNGRTNNIFGTIGEMFWVLAGQKNIDYHLSFFVPRAKNYSDDGKTWNASYGDRLWNYNQFKHILMMFKEDGLYTRRATQSIFIPGYDTYDEYMKREGSMKDIPCNQWINYFVVPQKDGTNKLHMKVCQRSGDIIFGTGNINIPEFSLIQEMLLCFLQKMFPEEKIVLGEYIQSVTNLHLYDMTFEQGKRIYDSNQDELIKTGENDNISLLLSDNYSGDILSYCENTYNFFKELYEVQTDFIIAEFPELIFSLDAAEEIFDKYNVPKENNILYYYAVLAELYIISAKFGADKDDKADFAAPEFIEKLKEKIPGLYQSVANSGFRNFEI